MPYFLLPRYLSRPASSPYAGKGEEVVRHGAGRRAPRSGRVGHSVPTRRSRQAVRVRRGAVPFPAPAG